MGKEKSCRVTFDHLKKDLPMRKRFTSILIEEENALINDDTSEEEEVETRIGPKQHFGILPGVIRHTSQPSKCLAFYYNYRAPIVFK